MDHLVFKKINWFVHESEAFICGVIQGEAYFSIASSRSTLHVKMSDSYQVIDYEGFEKRSVLFNFKEDANSTPEAYLKYVED
jgi:hypothetical protein